MFIITKVKIKIRAYIIKFEGDWLLWEDKVRKFVLYHKVQMIILCSIIGLTILSKASRWHVNLTKKALQGNFDNQKSQKGQNFLVVFLMNGLSS